MRKILRTVDISNKIFRLLILKNMKINIDELIKASNFIEKEISIWFLAYRENIIRDVIKIREGKFEKYINEYLLTIKRYEKIRRREIQKSFNKFNKVDQERKILEKDKYLEILNRDIYLKDKNWRVKYKDLLEYGPISDTRNCLKIKNAIKENMTEELKEILDLLPERIINAIIMQKYKIFRKHINNLFSGKIKLALDEYPIIDIHVTFNKLQLGYVKFNYSNCNSLKCYIGYKKDSKLYPFEREKYNYDMAICDDETINNIENEGIDITNITEDEQFEVFITRETKDDSYLLNISHGVREEYEDIKNYNCLFLRTNDDTYELEPINNIIDEYKNINIKSSEYNSIIRELKNKYSQLINLDKFKNEENYGTNEYDNRHANIICKLEELRILYIKLSINISLKIKKYCETEKINLVVIYYRPDTCFNINAITMNGKIIINLLKYLSEFGIECILIDQTNKQSSLYRKFKEADICVNKYKEINNYILESIKNIEFTNDNIKILSKHNNNILKNDRMGIKRIYCNGNSTYYL